jgi:hypothetical protein
MAKYILILSDPENSTNEILAEFVATKEALVQTFIDQTELYFYFRETEYFNFVTALMFDVKEVFSAEFLKNVAEHSNLDAVQEEFEANLPFLLDHIEREEGLVKFFDNIKVGNRIVFLIEDSSGVWDKLERNQFTFTR